MSEVRYQFLQRHLGQFSVAALCRAMRVTGGGYYASGYYASGYYAWRKREPSERQKQNQTLLGHIRTFFERSAQANVRQPAHSARSEGSGLRMR